MEAGADSSSTLDLIHPYWVNLFHLDSLKGEVKTVPARSLLGPWRFGLFAKMVYIRYRDSRPHLAKRVYQESMRCTNPLWKEYGKEKEKNRFRIFIKVFNELIDTFSNSGFDPGESIVPVGAERHIIDGEHRVSTLAFFDKEVTICEFPVTGMYNLKYRFYRDRGMSDYCMDLTVYESAVLLKNLRVICLWPGEHSAFPDMVEELYSRSFNLGRKACSMLRSAIDPGWSGEAAEGEVRFVFYLPHEADLAAVNGVNTIVYDQDEVLRVSKLVLTWCGRRNWYHGGGIACLLLAPWAVAWDKLRSDYCFIRYKVKFILARWNNKHWITFYNNLKSFFCDHGS